MENLRLCYAAAAACVGIVGLGSCNQDETVYQGIEEDISKLKVITRTNDESTKPNEGKIYIFNEKGLCADTISPENLKNNTPIKTKPGAIKLIAIGSNDLTAYNLPNKNNVTDSSIIKLNNGRSLTDLILGTTTTTLEEGETTQTDITMSREVLCFKHLTADKIPADIIGTEIMIGPMYKNIKLNGKYTNDVDTVRFILQKDPSQEGFWTYKGDSVFSLPSVGKPSIILRLKTVDTTKEYTFQANNALRKNRYMRLEVDLREGIKTFFATSFSNPEWEGTDSIEYRYQKDDITKEETVQHPVAGGVYSNYYVVSVDKSKRTAVLLRRNGADGITNDSIMKAATKSINKPAWAIGGWRLPTVDESRYFLSNAKIYDPNVTGKNYMVKYGTYYCTKNNELITITMSGETKRTLTENAFTGYTSDYIFRPVIEVSY